MNKSISLWVVVGLMLCTFPATAVVVRLIGTYGHKYSAVSSSLCGSGEACIYRDTADDIVKIHKVDNSVSALGGGGSGTVTSIATSSPLGGGTITTTGTLTCATCVVTGGSTMTGPFVLSGTQTGTYTLGGTPTLSAPLISTGLTASGSAANNFSGSTGDFSLSTGALSWAGASGKAASIVATSAAITITAAAASTWKTTTGALTLNAGGTNSQLILDNSSGTTIGYTSSNQIQFGSNTIVAVANQTWKTNTGYIVKRTTVADLAYTVLVNDYYVEYTSLTATRAVTLPSSTAGTMYIVCDGAGTANANNLTFTSASTVSGLTTINTAYGCRTFIGTGSRWIGY